ncbi:MAG: PaaI family thioesterase [Phycisphaerales bacterium]|jgi:acyl-coenzyme A thioesterase PaaI-like protein|nr:PaaI family thioesterase [Phycisphaerales bacterium]
MSDPTQERLEQTRSNYHARCLVCARPHDNALALEFEVCPDGSVRSGFPCEESFEGYNGLLHGGVISSIVDGAMTNCLFAHGIVAVTADLNVRFRHPVELLVPLEVTAKITLNTGPLYHLEARLTQCGVLKAKAAAKFMKAPAPLAKQIEEDSGQKREE